MRSDKLRVLVVLVAVAMLTTAAQAQRRARPRARARVAAAMTPRFGGHLGYNTDSKDALIGAQVSYPVGPRLELYPSFDYYFQDPGSLWALNFDVKFHPPTRYGALYVGGGINYSHASVFGVGGSDTNLNLLAGLERHWRPRVQPYVEMKLILGDNSSLQLAAGVSWGR